MPNVEPLALTEARNASARTLLQVENAARLRLNETVRRTVSSAPISATRADLVHTAHRIESSVAADVALIRAASRRESKTTFVAELRAGTGQPLLASTKVVDDMLSAAQVGKAYSAAWLATAIQALNEERVREAMRAATLANAHRIETIAITEVASPFSEERDRIGSEHAERARRSFMPVPFKVWWGILDRRRCPRCRDLHGTVRLLGMAFRGGLVPGSAHPRCRCFESIAAFGVTYESEEEADAV